MRKPLQEVYYKVCRKSSYEVAEQVIKEAFPSFDEETKKRLTKDLADTVYKKWTSR